MLSLAIAATMPLTSCNDDNDDFSTEQYVGGVHLNVFGPSPVARGGELRFIGSGMNQIVKVVIPGCDEITDIQRVSNEEIRVTVPQTAEPGKVQLHYAGGIIETKSVLTYSEPISIDEISPLKVRPGAKLTIKGDYLNLIKEVSFAFLEDSVNVYADKFIAHDRKTIELTVPDKAVSGIVILSDAKEIPNTIKSEETVEIVLPAVAAPLDLTDAKGGDLVTVAGTDLDLVRSIVMPDESEVEFKYADNKITFTLPDNATDGTIVAVPESGVRVAVANIGIVVPTELKATPATELRGGDQIVIAGLNMDQVVSVSFPNAGDAVTPDEVTATAVKVAFPATAQSGNAVLNLKSGKTVEIELSTAKPEVTGFDPAVAAAAGTVKLIGKNLDLVATVAFAGCAAQEVTAGSAAELTLDVPAMAQTGALTLNMANGESVTTGELTVNAPECAFITEQNSEKLAAGEIASFTVSNGDKLTGVTVNGQPVQYIINGTTLLISLPGNCGKSSVITLISSNGEISYTYDTIPATHVENVIFTEMRDLGNWAGEGDGGAFRLYKESFKDVPAGAKLVFHIAPYSETQIQVNDANWGQMAMLEPALTETTAVFELTAEILDRILTTNDGWSETAMVVQGKGTVVNKVHIEWENSLETTIWEGSWDSLSWGGNQDLAWGGFDWSTVKAGQVLRLYLNQTDPNDSWFCLSLRHGDSWGDIGGDYPKQYDTPASPLEIVIDQYFIDDMIANGGLVITGANFTLTKVTIE